jgi:hypothetical protein
VPADEEEQMVRNHRSSTTGVLILCLIGTQLSGRLFASDEEQTTIGGLHFTLDDQTLGSAPAGVTAPVSRSVFKAASPEFGSFAQRERYRGRRGRRHDAATAALILGAVGTITGSALLVYANRPECRANQYAGGCGYGTKVVGGAVLSAGAVGLVIGALTWR